MVPVLFNTLLAVPKGSVTNVLSADAYMRSPWLIEVMVEEFEIIPLVSRSTIRTTFEARLDHISTFEVSRSSILSTFEARLDHISTFEVSRASILSTFEARLDQIPMFEYSRFVIRVTSAGVVPPPPPPPLSSAAMRVTFEAKLYTVFTSNVSSSAIRVPSNSGLIWNI